MILIRPESRPAVAGAALVIGSLLWLDAPAADDVPTFAGEIAPILFEHCAGCHRPQGPAPFSLLTYEDAARRRRQIVTVTRDRVMPPWLPAPGYGDFIGQRGLDDEAIELIRRWVDGGASRGDPAHEPDPPTFGEG
jgi:mono/diheme cytochrome c family protein